MSQRIPPIFQRHYCHLLISEASTDPQMKNKSTSTRTASSTSKENLWLGFLIRVWWLWGTVKLLSPFKASMNSFYQYIFYRTRKTFNWLLWDGTLNGREDCGLSVYLKIHSKYTRWRIKWIEVIMILIQGLLSEAEITEGFRVVSMNLHAVLWRQIHLDYMIVSKVFFMQMAA